MALDGIVLSNIIYELKKGLVGGRIEKIYQPEKEELLLTIRNNRKNLKLLLSSNSQYPRLGFSTLVKNQTDTPPMFCMFLRKHIGGGKIINISQPNFERIVNIEIEAQDDLGDITTKILILEIMGRHSNLILTLKQDDNLRILDSIKHISYDKSKVRPILPNYIYSYPPSQNKLNPLDVNKKNFIIAIDSKDGEVYKRIYQTFSGLSPLIASEICLNADVESNTTNISQEQLETLYSSFEKVMEHVKLANFSPVFYENPDGTPVDYYSFELNMLADKEQIRNSSISEVIEQFTHGKSQKYTTAQKTSDIKKLILNFIDRAVRKQAIQNEAIKESENSEKYKIYGELITAYSYNIKKGDKSFKAVNYYSENQEEITIELDPMKTPIENAQSYFKKYTKLKRTFVAAKEQLEVIKEDLEYLQSVIVSLDLLQNESDILELRQELIEMGYLKRKHKDPKKKVKNQAPYMKFKTSSDLVVYVGKNNFQNDDLTMKFAKANDLWFHIKAGPGSHVIMKIPNGYEATEDDLYEGAMLAAYFSSGKQSSNVPIDYTTRKNVKKVPGAKPGMVIYYNFKTISITPTEKAIQRLEI
ncbi:hypothetical protein AN641_04940 [Candidatus Epulonipiscioides gigas]|nr:hypothetical protein AN641_04940 [Epulopiscium sp. SCG-C07WGA-EpuloA2]